MRALQGDGHQHGALHPRPAGADDVGVRHHRHGVHESVLLHAQGPDLVRVRHQAAHGQDRPRQVRCRLHGRPPDGPRPARGEGGPGSGAARGRGHRGARRRHQAVGRARHRNHRAGQDSQGARRRRGPGHRSPGAGGPPRAHGHRHAGGAGLLRRHPRRPRARARASASGVQGYGHTRSWRCLPRWLHGCDCQEDAHSEGPHAFCHLCGRSLVRDSWTRGVGGSVETLWMFTSGELIG
mmetsp:Transcript_123691/g.309135  ORF Transcript_123691/g.309135 Transcript_123691/m.309135 type:complete len:238 (-) Transcript_123691:42-755(-)